MLAQLSDMGTDVRYVLSPTYSENQVTSIFLTLPYSILPTVGRLRWLVKFGTIVFVIEIMAVWLLYSYMVTIVNRIVWQSGLSRGPRCKSVTCMKIDFYSF